MTLSELFQVDVAEQNYRRVAYPIKLFIRPPRQPTGGMTNICLLELHVTEVSELRVHWGIFTTALRLLT